MHVKTVNVTNPRNVLVQVPSFVIANWGVALGSHLEVHYDEIKRAIIIKPTSTEEVQDLRRATAT